MKKFDFKKNVLSTALILLISQFFAQSGFCGPVHAALDKIRSEISDAQAGLSNNEKDDSEICIHLVSAHDILNKNWHRLDGPDWNYNLRGKHASELSTDLHDVQSFCPTDTRSEEDMKEGDRDVLRSKLKDIVDDLDGVVKAIAGNKKYL